MRPAAQYNTQVDLEVFTPPAKDALGHVDPTATADWSDVATIWAKVVPKNSREFTRAGITDDEINRLVLVRFSPVTEDLTEQPADSLTRYRLDWRGRKLAVKYADLVDGESHEIIIQTKDGGT